MSLGDTSLPWRTGQSGFAESTFFAKPTFAKPTFLMCSPKLYEVNYVINPWMEGNVHRASRERATSQWERLYDALTELACVELVEPQAGSPDMVFTANA